MEKLFVNIVQMSISASYLILAVLLVRFLLRRAPKNMRSFLWLLVGIRLVIPFSVESVFSLIPDMQAVDGYIYELQQDTFVYEPAAAGKQPVGHPGQNTYAPSVQTTGNNVQIAVAICTRVWFAGVVLMLGYMLLSWLRLKNRVRMSVPLEVSTEVPLGGSAVCADDNNNRTDRNTSAKRYQKIYRSSAITSPFLFGIVHPRIYIPDSISSEQLPYVIRHEMTHRQRKDHLIKPAAFLLLSLYWFNPCVWAAYLMLCRDIELICDERVVRALGAAHKKAYSQALLNSAVNRRMIAACPVAFGELGVKERVKNVLHYKKPAFWLLAAAVLACIIVTVCFMTQRKGTSDTADSRSEADAQEGSYFEEPGSTEPESEDFNLDDMVAGTYEMLHPDHEKYFMMPGLSLNKNGSFSFGYDPFSSYMPCGNYEFVLDRIKAVTIDGQYHYQFTQIGDGLLRFDADASSDVSRIGGEQSMAAPVVNGSVFFKNSAQSALNDAEELSLTLEEGLYSGTAATTEEFADQLNALAEMQKRLTVEQLKLSHQLDTLDDSVLNQEEIDALEKRLLDLSQELQDSLKQLEDEMAFFQSEMNGKEKLPAAAKAIEQWARAFCDRDAGTIIRLADEDVENHLIGQELLSQDFDGKKDTALFGWSSPWPWGSSEDGMADNYYIVSATERSAEILYYAWVSDPHVTVWRELLTYKMEEDGCIITSETLQFMDGICIADEFYQAYPNGITGTMMDYYSFNGAGEALNQNAKENQNSTWYKKLFEPDTAAVYLLNILNNPNKVGTRVTNSGTDADVCTVTFTFYEDGSSVSVQMIRPYGSDGIWLPYTGAERADASDTSEAVGQSQGANPDTSFGASYMITGQNVADIVQEDARQLEALFPNHHDAVSNVSFPQNADLNGDGVNETIEFINLGYNGGDGGYAVRVTDGKTGRQIPLPDGYTEESGFPIVSKYIMPDREEPRLLIQLNDENMCQTLATVLQDSLFYIYDRNHMDSEFKKVLSNTKTEATAAADAVSGCNIVTLDYEENPVVLLKTYVSGFLGHADTLGYVVTELRLQKDNTWISRHYFLFDSCQ